MTRATPLHDITSQAGATFTEVAGWQIPAYYGDINAEYQYARTGCVLVDVSARGKIELTGPEAGAFLHNLSTNNINELPIGAGCEAFFCNQRARVLMMLNVYLLRLHDGLPAYHLDLPPGANEATLKHLDHFRISEQVEFTDRTLDFAQIHLAGPTAKATLEKALVDDVPDLDEHQHMMRTFGTQATCSIRKVSPLGVLGYDILCLKNRASIVWQMLVRASGRPMGAMAAEILRIEAGTPRMGQDIDETTFAPEVGRTEQAISYHKGCYLGQEPIVMARDRGQINRILRGLKLPNVVPHNSKLFAEDQEVGRVTSSAHSPRLGAVGLGYVRRLVWEPGTKISVDVDGERKPVEVVALPFAG